MTTFRNLQQKELADYLGISYSCTKSRVERARMFAPRYGIEEEAGTGMAAGPLACYLYDKIGLQKDRFLIQQGNSLCKFDYEKWSY